MASTFLGDFLKKEAQRVLQSQTYACLLVVMLALIPLGFAASLTIVALVTLRQGYHKGLQLVIAGMAAYVFVAFTGLSKMPLDILSLLAYLVCYLSAYLLKRAQSWQVVLPSVLSMVLIFLLILQYAMPAYAEASFLVYFDMLQSLKSDMFVDALKQPLFRDFIASYSLGIQGFVLVTISLFPVLIARYMQSLLFYPEGFRKEVLAFRASRFVLLLSLSCFVFIQHSSLVAASSLPLLIFYLMVSGISFSYKLLSRKNDRVILVVLFLPAVLAPYIMFPLYVLLGCFDSLVRIRPRF